MEKPEEISIVINLDENPRPTSRPRSSFSNGRMHVYADSRSRNFKNMLIKEIKGLLYDAYGNDVLFPIYNKEDPISLVTKFVFVPTASRYRIITRANGSKYVEDLVPMLLKPDADNLQKMVMDASSGIIYEDDACVYDERSIKLFNMATAEPYIEILFTLN